MADMTSILNTILANASTEYTSRVPVATQTNITAVGNPITSYQPVQNEFLDALIGRIALTVVRQKMFTNPLAILKKGGVPLGSDIQEIFVDMAKDQGFDGAGDKLLTKTTPNVKAIYHRINRKSQYPITVSLAELQTAFTSYDELQKLMTKIIRSLYSGDSMDEFILMKNTFASAIADGKIVTSSIAKPSDQATSEAFLNEIMDAVSYFKYPSSSFNKYDAIVGTGDGSKAVKTWTEIEEQVLIIRSDVLNKVKIKYLAGIFNVSEVEMKARLIEVDSFGSAETCLAILCDKSILEVRDNLSQLTNFYNGQGMYWNYWWNHWQTYSFSLFANAVAFVEPMG